MFRIADLRLLKALFHMMIVESLFFIIISLILEVKNYCFYLIKFILKKYYKKIIIVSQIILSSPFQASKIYDLNSNR